MADAFEFMRGIFRRRRDKRHLTPGMRTDAGEIAWDGAPGDGTVEDDYEFVGGSHGGAEVPACARPAEEVATFHVPARDRLYAGGSSVFKPARATLFADGRLSRGASPMRFPPKEARRDIAARAAAMSGLSDPFIYPRPADETKRPGAALEIVLVRRDEEIIVPLYPHQLRRWLRELAEALKADETGEGA